jgi:GT2 family glycosyltransferase
MNMRSGKRVLISIVTHNDAHFVERCLESVMAQTCPVNIRVFDNASTDETVEIAEKTGVSIFGSGRNVGFCRGHNQVLLNEEFEFALLLNADVILEPDYLAVLVDLMTRLEKTGMAGGKLFRINNLGVRQELEGRPVLDSTGIFFTPSQRHFDRGSGQKDTLLYERPQYVFGVTGAALLCSRRMLEDLRLGDEYLDEDFFAYREDADLAWRAQLRGWNALYEPAARAGHVRTVLPERRTRLAPLINYHSLKNRYLMRWKNMDRRVGLKCLPFMLIRDLGILGYVLARERSSLGAYREVWRLREKLARKRRVIQESRLRSPSEIAQWFSFQPVAYDI